MKILCICDHGQVRSVAMAYVLSLKGHQTISCSEETYDRDDQDYLKNWADLRIDMTEKGRYEKDYGDCKNGWVGRDEFGNPHNPTLIQLCKDKADSLGL